MGPILRALWSCVTVLSDGVQAWPGSVALGLAVLLVWVLFRAP